MRRASDNSVLATLSWTSSGLVTFNFDTVQELVSDEILCFDITSAGIGAGGCQVTTWLYYV